MENGNYQFEDFNGYGQYGAPKKRSGGIIALIVVVALLFATLFGAAIFAAFGERNETQASPGPSESHSAAETSTAAPLVTGGLVTGGQEIFPDVTAPLISDQNEPAVEIFEKLNGTVVLVRNYVNGSLYGTGSGVIFHEEGYIITNQHVVEGATSLTVMMADEKTVYDVMLVGADERSDLAVLKIKDAGETRFPVAGLGNSAQLKVGQTVVAIGNPLGISNSVTQGIISGLNRAVDDSGRRFRMIQTDCALNPGNSGGPLFDRNGLVIGIVERKEIYTGDGMGGQIAVDGMSYAIPIDTVKTVVEQLMQHGQVKRAALGILCGTAFNDDYVPVGVRVESVVENGPSARAGIRAGDIITEIDGETVTQLEELTEIMESKVIGERAVIKVLRDGKTMEFTLELGVLEG